MNEQIKKQREIIGLLEKQKATTKGQKYLHLIEAIVNAEEKLNLMMKPKKTEL